MDLKQQVQNRVKKIEQQIKVGKSNKLTSEFVLTCLDDNALGSAELYKALHGLYFLYNKSGCYWMCWAGHHYEEDKMNFAQASVLSVAAVYEGEKSNQYKKLKELKQDDPKRKKIVKIIKKLERVIWNLKDTPYAKRVLELVHTSNNPAAIQGDVLDTKPYLLPCKNGVINLKTAELQNGQQRDFLKKYCPLDFPKDGIEANPFVWKKTLLEIFSGNQHLVDFFHRLSGYCLVGEVKEHIFVVFEGRGRNGKTLIIETFLKILGDMAVSIRPEMLLDQGRVGSSAPDPGLMRLQGARVAFGSETEEGRMAAPARIKSLSGGDSVVARNPYDKYEISFKQSHTLILSTNNKPHAPADDFAFWERMIVIPFDLSFVNREPKNEKERRADLDLSHKLEKELPEILAWMVKGCLEWQEQGLNPPAIVKQAVEEYRRDEDVIQDFIEECCIVGDEYSVGATKVYEAFKDWWRDNVSNKTISQRRFGDKFKKKFKKKKYQTVSYSGVGLLE